MYVCAYIYILYIEFIYAVPRTNISTVSTNIYIYINRVITSAAEFCWTYPNIYMDLHEI